MSLRSKNFFVIVPYGVMAFTVMLSGTSMLIFPADLCSLSKISISALVMAEYHESSL